MVQIDLHVHTRESDGSKSKIEVLEEALALGLDTIAITDHDVIHKKSDDERIKIVAGVEMSSIYDNGGLFHILGYHINPNSPTLKKIAHENLLAEVEHNRYRDKVFMKAFSMKYKVDMEDYMKYPLTSEPIPGQQFISKAQSYIIEKNYCKNRHDFFTKIFPGIFPKGIHWGYPSFASPQAVIHAIKEAGGIAILAHPFSKRHKLALEESLKLFETLDIDGYECFHPNASNKDISTCLQWATSQQRYITGGSDYHGGRQKRQLGLSQEQLAYINLPL